MSQPNVPPTDQPTGPSPFTTLDEPRPRAVTLRSVLLGLLGVIFICGLSPYNDWAVANTLIVGNFLPIGLVLVMLVLVLVLNAALHRWIPANALRESELAIVMAMMLAACSMPSSGLMRYLPSSVIGLYTTAATSPDAAKSLAEAGIPAWLMPDSGADPSDPAAIGRSKVFDEYRSRSSDNSVPWMAWLRPLAIWGVFVALLWGLMMFLTLIVRRQWAENERLAFPLATVYASLIEAPEPGHCVNTLFRSHGFWIAASAVFILHGFNGLHEYFPRVPEIPRVYDFIATFADPPLSYTFGDFRRNEVMFSIVGMAFFLQSKTSFSLWFMFVLLQGVLMILGSAQYTLTEQMRMDQTFGGAVVMTGVIIYVGRHHWWMVIRHMFGASRPDENESRYLPYAFAGWGAFVCWLGVMGFFVAMGASPIGALCLSLVLVMLLMLVARVVAETGLIFVQINWLMNRFWYYPLFIPDEPIRTTPGTYFVTSYMTLLFHDLRESFAAFFLTGTRVADVAAYENTRRWKTAFSYVLAVVLALFVGYWVSAASMLWTEYNYAASMSEPPVAPINQYAVEWSPRTKLLDTADIYRSAREEGHSQAFHIGLGATIVGVLSVLRLTLSWWPLHPIAFVLLSSWAINRIWFSIMLGWLAKVIMVRFGGSTLLKTGRPIFIGLVVGEATAAAFWMIVSLVANWMGYEYHRIVLLPY